ncbi:MAG TPA: 6-phosphogluconolactonase [Planctomycetota bacterium]|nr:6-phosphogluconolactonase [Planctomycetota bacterium]
MPQPNFSITVSKDPDALAREAAGAIEQFAQNFVAAHGAFNIALSGGATPKSVYALLRQSIKMPWPQTRLFWGDERYVPHDHADSNYRMVNEALLQNGPVPPENIFPIPTIQPTAADAAAYYEGTLLEKIARKSDDFPVFDLILLGIGPDGHTASIFPGTRAALEMARAVTWSDPTVANPGVKPAVQRVTITTPVIWRAENVFVLAEGESKREMLAKIFAPDPIEAPPVARLLRQCKNAVRFFLDDAANPTRS